MSTKKINRRKFVKLAGATALIGADLWDQAALADRGNEEYKANLSKFDYVVVLLLENRSFDNMLGYLYQNNSAKTFNGVYGKSLSNPIPSFANRSDLGVVPVMQGANPQNHCPDPGEEYPHVNTQLFGCVAPASNRTAATLFMSPPYNLPAGIPAPLMEGFVYDYINNFENTVGRSPRFDEYKVIMECFAPQAVPVISTLAREFAVCDNWFCFVPSQRSEWPQTIPRPVERPTSDDTLQLPLNQLQSSIFKTVQAIAKQQGLSFPDVATIGEALFHMKRMLPSK